MKKADKHPDLLVDELRAMVKKIADSLGVGYPYETLEEYIEQMGTTIKRIYHDALGMEHPTWQNRLKDPSTFQIGEVILLAKFYRVSREEMFFKILASIDKKQREQETEKKLKDKNTEQGPGEEKGKSIRRRRKDG